MNVSHIPIDLSVSDFNFTDCKLAASWGSTLQLANDLPTISTTFFLYHGLEGYRTRHPNTNLSTNENMLYIWFLDRLGHNDTSFFDLMLRFTSETCLKESAKVFSMRVSPT